MLHNQNTKTMKTEQLTLPIDLIERLTNEATQSNLSITDLLYKLLEQEEESELDNAIKIAQQNY